MQLRLFFPLFPITQIIGGVDSAYKKEISKLRNWGINYITPHLQNKKYYNYPYKITIIFYIYGDFDMVSMLTLSAYTTRLLGQHCFQSSDYRVIPQLTIKSKHVLTRESEGCEIIIERLRKK
jgi:hypothetical protein